MDEGIAIDVVNSCPPSESDDEARRKIWSAWNEEEDMAGIKISIADLRPTQLMLGMSEVTQRAAKILKLSADDRKAYPGMVQSRSDLAH
jgi:hypothetical protein